MNTLKKILLFLLFVNTVPQSLIRAAALEQPLELQRASQQRNLENFDNIIQDSLLVLHEICESTSEPLRTKAALFHGDTLRYSREMHHIGHQIENSKTEEETTEYANKKIQKTKQWQESFNAIKKTYNTNEHTLIGHLYKKQYIA
jgi:hypothetical protein